MMDWIEDEVSFAKRLGENRQARLPTHLTSLTHRTVFAKEVWFVTSYTTTATLLSLMYEGIRDLKRS